MINKFIAKNLITSQEYAKIKHKTPYILNFSKDGQEIVYFGSRHSKNPKDKQFSKMEILFNKFLNKHNKRDVIIILENYTPHLTLPRDEMIKKFGETGLLYYLAQKYKLKTICPEPSQKQILEFVKSRRHNVIDILLWIFINVLYNKMAAKKKKSITEDLFKETFTIIKRGIKTKRSSRLERRLARRLRLILRSKIKKSLFEGLKELRLKNLKKLQNPFIYYSNLNKVGSDFNLARDYYISQEIIKYFHKGESIFAVFGINHPVCQKGAILAEIKRPETQTLVSAADGKIESSLVIVGW